MKETLKGLFTDPLFTAFWLYLGKVMYQGMSLYDAIFMASLVGIHTYRHLCKHKEELKRIEVDTQMAARVLTIEANYSTLKSKVDDLATGVSGMNMVKRR